MPAPNSQQAGVSSASALRSALILMNQQEAYQADLERYSSSPRNCRSDDDTPTPIYNSYLENGEDVILKTTNFSPRELNSIWYSLREHVNSHWNIGRGAKSPYAGKDVFL
ncbi:hypothetical protein Ae201684P_015428 [Aphanomyces euteiches]|uniref:Uncharacterized protein n=1 Tax=Aphanomyces euteiches TaxID=100861 RepID=A0A6G0WQE1_9STRA|nr:hypothetical protein Ae201684_012712 [Aphanomyces euteiches]KAH9095627.1 hypothetical protein Ae201684P_015428 [Aphanomyces euteiches]